MNASIIERQQLRRIDGVVLLDKPIGLSSNAALQTVKQLYRARKAGHGGSLDPLASGLLPICLGEATKFSGMLLNADKSYRFTCRLGVTTSTGDAEGEVLRTRAVGQWDRAALDTVQQRFCGEILQIPPMYSALKHQGQRLYKLARRGVTVDRPPRKVTIHDLQIFDLRGELLEAHVCCSKGTYVRTLAEDMGEVLGCGAHLISLRRTWVEPYTTAHMVTLAQLQQRVEQGLKALDALLLPVDTAITGWPAVQISDPAVEQLLKGRVVALPQALAPGWVRLYGFEEKHFLGVGEVLNDGRIAPRRLLAR